MKTRPAVDRQRGATLALIAFALVVLLPSAALAVDIAARANQAQTLQNSADAAALAGVATWTSTADEVAARTTIDEVLRQNGVPEFVMPEVTFHSDSKIEVVLTNSSPGSLLPGVAGVGGALSRDAIAEFTPCNIGCGGTWDVPKPLQPINYEGTGDGYRPIVVDGKVYAVRHHDRTIACIDRQTNDECWPDGDRRIFSNSDTYTMNTTHPYLVGSRIYFLGFVDDWNNFWREFPANSNRPANPGKLLLGCWDTATDSRCPETDVTSGERQGTFVGTDQGLFVFTNERKAYCFDPFTLDACSSSYNGGRDLASASESKWTDIYVSFRNSTHRVHAGKIYTTVADNGAHHLQCWNIGAASPCTGFGTPEANDDAGDHRNDIWVEGRLFFRRATDGTPDAICSSGKNQIHCFDLDTGARIVETTLDNFADTWVAMRASTPSAGQHTYHEASNRTFFLGQANGNSTYCWDWTAGGSCGTVDHTSPLGELKPYGYFATTECLFGLGHNERFWTLKPDLTGGCDQGSLQVNVAPCLCGDEPEWPIVSAVNLEGVDEFNVRLLDATGDVLYPDDGSFIDLTSDELDLSLILATLDPVRIEVLVSASNGENPWKVGTAFPQLSLVSPAYRPFLVG